MQREINCTEAFFKLTLQQKYKIYVKCKLYTYISFLINFYT